ncbi:MAG: HugZ family protein [Nitrospiria bacterium]
MSMRTSFEEKDLRALADDCKRLLAAQRTLLISTATAGGEPEISVAPYVRDEAGIFYVFVSELASHTRNLMENGRASILFIGPESASRNLFARERAVFRCRAEEVPAADAVYTRVLKSLQDVFGEVVGVLRSLPDFHLFALRPENGRYIVGFGQAYRIQLEDGSMEYIRPKQPDADAD